MLISESIIQTRIPEKLSQKLKLHALRTNLKLKEDFTNIIITFVEKKPWLTGTWIKQPKTTSEFKPLTVKIPKHIGLTLESTAASLEVSTSSLAYTAIDWFLSN